LLPDRHFPSIPFDIPQYGPPSGGGFKYAEVLLIRRRRAIGSAKDQRSGYRTLRSILRYLTALLLIVSLTSSPHAQRSGTEIEFDIQAQPLDTALEAYMRVTGLQVLYRSALTTARVSTRVVGQLTPSRALETLLTGTGLGARFTVEGAFTIVAKPIPQVAARRLGYESFLGNAQDRILLSLCRNPITRPGGYRAALQFSVGASGIIDDASLLDSTGDPTRDRLITDALRGLALGQAVPENMPQPVTMLIGPHNDAPRNECQRFAR
jgi:hypothetical protein